MCHRRGEGRRGTLDLFATQFTSHWDKHVIEFMRPSGLIPVFLLLALLSRPTHAHEPAPNTEPTALEAIARAYQIEVTANPTFPVRASYGTIDGKSADRGAVERYTSLFVAEFALYPRELIQRAKLKRVVLCAELSFAGQRRNAIPDFEHDTLYFDVERGASNRTYLRKVIHHEFFHIIDLRDDGQLYADKEWAALNPRAFKYGSGGANAQGVANTSTLTDAVPGFLNHYSTTGVEEDKAEVFANLIVDSAYIEKRIKTDAVLDAKVERMKALMKRFCPDVDELFWDAAKKIDRRDRPRANETEAQIAELRPECLCPPACVAHRWRLFPLSHRSRFWFR